MWNLRKTTESLTDEQLLSKYRQGGDQSWLGVLFERYVEWVYGVCLRYFDSPPEAEDAVMGIFEELLVKARQHEIQHFKGWLHTYAKNYCLMRLRKSGRESEALKSWKITEEEALWLPPLEEETTFDRLRECLEGLSAFQRQCIMLFYYEGHSYVEIGEKIKEPVGTVRSYIQNGRRNLRNCIGDDPRIFS